VNQFFGGIGGEDKAHVGPFSKSGPTGPGKIIQTVLGKEGDLVGTVGCGDNYFAENLEQAANQVVALIREFQPDVVLAGPAFNAGRYGVACAAASKAVQQQLAIPVVTGMHEENPGLEMCRQEVYVVPTADSVRGMAEAVPRMVKLALRLAKREKLGSPSSEGYFPRGVLTNEWAAETGAVRVVEMLVRKLKGESFESEVKYPAYDRIPPAAPIKDLRSATIALVTDGGLVPKGNPDKIQIKAATRFGSYNIAGVVSLRDEDYEVSHEGYDSVYVRQDPNRLVPVDVLRQMEGEKRIGKLHDRFYSTTGVACSVAVVKKMGEQMARELKSNGVSGVILTST
jgi:glycine reductase